MTTIILSKTSILVQSSSFWRSIFRYSSTSIKNKPSLNRKSLKKTNSKQLNDDYHWSVVAYNLSDELKIDNVNRMLENFKEYQMNSLPEDLQDEAIMLSLKKLNDTTANKTFQPLHDIFLFREGSIVFWGVPYEQQRRILYGLSSLKIDPYSNDMIQEEREHLNYNFNHENQRSRMNRDVVELGANQEEFDLNLDKFAFSHAVASSVKLGIWEAILEKYIDSIAFVTGNMKSGKSIKLTKEQVFIKTGELYELKHDINLSSDLLDLPDIYWDRHNQESIYMSVISFLNIRRRTTVINEKLNNCCELMNLLASHMNDRHHIRLEWMIIVLITVEVMFEIVRFF